MPTWLTKLWESTSPAVRVTLLGMAIVLAGYAALDSLPRTDDAALDEAVNRAVAKQLAVRSRVDTDRAERILGATAQVVDKAQEMTDGCLRLVRWMMSNEKNSDAMPELRRLEAGVYKTSAALDLAVDEIKRVASEIRGGTDK